MPRVCCYVAKSITNGQWQQQQSTMLHVSPLWMKREQTGAAPFILQYAETAPSTMVLHLLFFVTSDLQSFEFFQ